MSASESAEAGSRAPVAEFAADEASGESRAAGASSSYGESASDLSAALGAATALTGADFGREIVYRATITVEVDDVAAAGGEAVAIVGGLGGIVFAQTTRTGSPPS